VITQSMRQENAITIISIIEMSLSSLHQSIRATGAIVSHERTNVTPCLTPAKFILSEVISSLLVKWINLLDTFILRSSHNALDRT
jgi:hypothetical protein